MIKGSKKIMDKKSLPIVFCVTFLSLSISGIKISSDGGYTDIVIKIGDQVPEDHCPEILQNLKVRSTVGQT